MGTRWSRLLLTDKITNEVHFINMHKTQIIYITISLLNICDKYMQSTILQTNKINGRISFDSSY